ncbi:MAG: 50S ribosomal protein L4 [Candidatus Marisimplicoccus sp.]|jgi:large subunit ribosomal protein L4|nr:50S ribosomal protein L4 [Cryomorphaceae bacterium]MBT7738931.1 50S ribosomal protein L4 [Cryomorphaceae bacterium]MCH1443861.1 50S ribosomal protein L4 [Flavobacteriaceae bacterium]MDC1034438.1 50S ribosomal protein L4 [Flavobacteriaceae bacterium]RZP01092.1 MAG: 50S ribosomal protein L4 [Flavobacteriales bacterium]|tara:strand:- start:1114 stop:1740 length:627 start_codon:yes stop_codon:yes gene_type:complete
MELKVHNIKGKETDKKVKLDKLVFGIEPNDHAIYLDVKQYLANNRKGLHKSKERGEIAGSTRKIKKQKGTGTARAGSIKNPLFRGGGRVFGPRPRSYDQKVNKKVKKLARKSALAYKAKNKEILILEDFNFSNPKTSDYLNIIKAFGLETKKTLVVTSDINNNIYLSSRNLKNSKVVINSELNTYEITDANNILILESAVEGIESTLK